MSFCESLDKRPNSSRSVPAPRDLEESKNSTIIYSRGLNALEKRGLNAQMGSQLRLALARGRPAMKRQISSDQCMTRRALPCSRKSALCNVEPETKWLHQERHFGGGGCRQHAMLTPWWCPLPAAPRGTVAIRQQ